MLILSAKSRVKLIFARVVKRSINIQVFNQNFGRFETSKLAYEGK